VDIHVEVDPELPVREGHAIGHAVKDRLVSNLVTVKDVLVHIEPAPGGVLHDRQKLGPQVPAAAQVHHDLTGP
jgi:divalent metal cation (Fe/Co/Zn/Cd) transporter